MTDTEEYLQKLIESNPLREPLLREAIRTLELPPSSNGLDAGCAVGLQAMLLAEDVGPEGHIIGLDKSPDFIDIAEKMVEKSSFSDQISFKVGDVNKLPFEDNTFDWAWSSDCIGYPTGDPLLLLKELTRVIKPGGLVAILAWSSQQLLPGYPLIEARLNATCSAYIPLVKESKPESNFLRALSWFHKDGFEKPIARTFLSDVQAPLSDEIRTALISLFEMLWGEPQPGESQEDREEYERLCRPESPDFILDLPEYYAFFTYTMFSGRVAK